MLAASLLCGWNAYRSGDTVFYISSLIYGLILEKAAILAFGDYSYPVQEYILSAGGVPLAIGLGWSAVIYVSWTMGRELGIPGKVLPVFTGLFALHFDLAGDPVAVQNLLWIWEPAGPLLGVPISNFLAWLTVPMIFVVAHRELEDRTGNWLTRIPGTVVLSTAGLVLLLKAWELVTPGALAEMILFSAIAFSSLLVVVRETGGLSPGKIALPVVAAGLLLSLFFLSAAVWTGSGPAVVTLNVLMTAVTALVMLSGRTDWTS